MVDQEGSLRDLLEAVNHHAIIVGMLIDASETNVVPTLIYGEQHQAILLNGEPVENVDKFKYVGSMSVANGQCTEGRGRTSSACAAFSRLQPCLWPQREIPLRKKGRVYQATVRSIPLYGCEMWPVLAPNKRMLAVFDKYSIYRILHVKRRD